MQILGLLSLKIDFSIENLLKAHRQQQKSGKPLIKDLQHQRLSKEKKRKNLHTGRTVLQDD